MDLGLKDKVAMVTGASRGIGQAIACALAEEGASLAICSRTEKDINETAKKISDEYGVRVHAEARDFTEPKSIQAFVKGAVNALAHIDILVNNVGTGLTKPFDELDDKAWQGVVDKNLWTTVRCCREVLPLMKKRGSGNIINIAALSGKRPRLGQIASNATKAALINFTESLACEMGPQGIRANAVCPAAVLTGRWEERVRAIARKKGKSYDATLAELARAKIPVGRFGVPEDVAALVAFLASDRSGFINGVSIEVDGGVGRYIRLDLE